MTDSLADAISPSSHGLPSSTNSCAFSVPLSGWGMGESNCEGETAACSGGGMFWDGEGSVLSEQKVELKGTVSGKTTCMPPYRRAASSWGERGRDFLRSFCRRFWNQIWVC